MRAGPYCPATAVAATSSGFTMRIDRSNFARSSRTASDSNTTGGSIAMVDITCSR